MTGRREIDADRRGRDGARREDAGGRWRRCYDAPCYVHNTANVRRHDSSPRELAKVWLTRRARRIARESINGRLAERIAAWRGCDGNVILLDETGLLDRYGETALGRLVYPNPIQHPGELGRLLADHYREILAAHADLVGKKVIVCDLDNTLWKGEIGEGAVEHVVDIQGTLKELRRKGVLLAINSKNDPRNVRWDGAVLGEDDFVAAEINWDSKVTNMRRIQQGLNLKLKDFVFIDDRADQRELVREALPEVVVLDATSPRRPGAAGHLGGRAVRIIPRWIGRSSIASASGARASWRRARRSPRTRAWPSPSWRSASRSARPGRRSSSASPS